jgi:hypothetical protein
MGVIRRPNPTNPYPDMFTLLFWHDLWKQMVEDHGADWREQSWWVNRNIPEFKSFNAERYQKPWKAIRAAYESKCADLEAAKREIDRLRSQLIILS